MEVQEWSEGNNCVTHVPGQLSPMYRVRTRLRPDRKDATHTQARHDRLAE